MFLIEVNKLSKVFKNKRVLQDISFNVPTGEILAVSGENGTGKSTLLKILATLILPSAGSAKVAGFNIVSQSLSARTSIGFMFEQSEGFYGRLTGWQNIEFFASLYNMKNHEIKNRIDELDNFFQIKKILSVHVQEYSSGMEQKLALVRAFIHSPKVLLLDEATKELDEGSCKMFWQFLNFYVKNQQRAALVVTHSQEEAKIANSVLEIPL